MALPQESAVGAGGDRRFGRTAGLLRARLRRRRVPTPTAASGRHWRAIGLAAVVAAGLAGLFLATLDAHAVAWADSLPKSVRSVFKTVTRFGKSDWLLIPTAIATVLLLAADWTAVERRVAAAWAEIQALIGFFFVAVAGAGLTTDLVKAMVGRSRPELFESDGVLTLQPIAFDSSFLSFPSGHATTATAAAVACILMMRRYSLTSVVLAVAAAAICISRVALRQHFPSDVVAGAFVGGAFTFGLAQVLGVTGVAFQRQPDGTLRAETVAIRGLLRAPEGLGRLARGLRDGLTGRAVGGS